MKMKPRNQSALTFVEVCVVAFILVVVVSLLLPSQGTKGRSTRIHCVNNLRQLGLTYLLWANDHENQFPFASTNALGSLRWVNTAEVFRHYLVMSNEMVTPKILACPVDKKRKLTATFDKLSNANLSYFVGLDAREDAPNSILSGDRNLTGGTLSNGFLRVLTPGAAAGWTKEIHKNEGDIGLGDGSVQQMTSMRLQKHVSALTNQFIRLAVP